MKEAMLYHRLNGDVRCDICAHRCRIKPRLKGICMVRENAEGTLYTWVYGRVVANEVDPIEKKPLFHFLPGTTAYSVATVGCNFHCRFCQNWTISQAIRPRHYFMGKKMSPDAIVEDASRLGSASIAYTYTEPAVFFEYAYDTARLAKQKGLRNIFVTNGYETQECVDAIAPYLDAANVDLKAFSDRYYRKFLGARLEPVLETLRYMKSKGIWIEITTLVIPELNDSNDELTHLAEFIAGDLGVDTPWHVSRFYPSYKMGDWDCTPAKTLLNARQIGKNAGLHYVYVGNLLTEDYENTLCPDCDAILIRRFGIHVEENNLSDGSCPNCHTPIAGVWEASIYTDAKYQQENEAAGPAKQR